MVKKSLPKVQSTPETNKHQGDTVAGLAAILAQVMTQDELVTCLGQKPHDRVDVARLNASSTRKRFEDLLTKKMGSAAMQELTSQLLKPHF